MRRGGFRFIKAAPPGPEARRDAEYWKKVPDSFFVYGKLVSIPVQRKKERIVPEEIAKGFSPGREYSEKEVNGIIGAYHEDYCTLRRDMISEGLLSRDHGVYRLVPAKEK